MANDNGDYLSRFEQMEKTLQGILEVQKLQGQNLAALVTVQQGQVERMGRMDTRMDNLATKVDDLVGAIRSLIDRIPPENLSR
jgi:hypothetical protein